MAGSRSSSVRCSPSGWLVTTVAQEIVGSPVVHRDRPRRTEARGALAPLLAITAFPFVAVTLLAEISAFSGDVDARVFVSFAAAGIVDAALTRRFADRVRIATILAPRCLHVRRARAASGGRTTASASSVARSQW